MIIEKEKIQKAKEKLGDRNAIIMAEELNIEDFDEHNLKSCCPFHKEDTPSFIFNPKNHSFHCFGCQKTVDIIDVFMLKNITYLEAVKKLFDLAGVKCSFGELGVKTQHQYRYPHEEPINNKTKITEYLALRKINPSTIEYADVREDRHGNIVFNYYDTNDVLTMVKYRPSHKIQKGEAKNWCQTNADTTPLLFNMNRINSNSPLLICEGEIDCLSAIEAGYSNAVSVPLGAGNYGWIETNWDWLEQFETIIICSDNDEPGMKLRKEVAYRLGSWRTKIVEIPDVLEVDGRKQAIKDLNEVLFFASKDKVIDLILHAKDTPVDSVVDYADIKDVDLNEIDGIKTGIKDLDRYIFKLFYGTFNILTGINSSGKSSFVSQLICESLEQDANVFLYSGEMANHQIKSWINYIFAGQRNVKKFQHDDSEYWRVTPEATAEINDYYRGRLFIYKDGHPRTADAILRTIEDTVRKYGCKFVVIDNLTAINLESNNNNKWEKQAEFVTELIDLCKKYNIVIVLAVHPHKMDMVRRMNKMDIAGVMALTDLAHRVFSLYRVSTKDKKGIPKTKGTGWVQEPIKHDVILDVLKDRMLGREGEVLMFYDNPSRRFFTNEHDLDRQYLWDKKRYDTSLPFPPPQLNDKEDEVFGKI